MKRAPESFAPPVSLNPQAGEPLHRQLYNWFRRAIVNGQLRPQQAVPSTRTLARQLRISRIPVLQAFDQLKAEGYLQSVVGAGTRVSSSIPQQALAGSKKPSSPVVHRRGLRRIAKVARLNARMESASHEPWLNILGPFRMHSPALDEFPTEIWSRLVARHARRRAPELMAYGRAMGYEPFRQTLAQYLRTVRGVRCETEQVMVVSGSQQALALCARVLLDPAERVWIEDPGYPGAHQAFRAAGSRMMPVPVDEEGLDVEEGMRRHRTARAVYVTPSHQYPLGATMSVSRRIQLLNWASESGAWIIEDDYDSEYRQAIRPIASLQGLDSDARVLYIGTFSKALFPALRVGYLIIPPDLIPTFAEARDAADGFPSTLYQAVLADFMREGHFARHVRKMRVLYASRCNALAAALDSEMGELVEVVNGGAGMHLVILLPAGISDTALSRTAAQHGISAMPLSICSLMAPKRQGLVLGYGGAEESQILPAVRRLRMILENATRARSARASC